MADQFTRREKEMAVITLKRLIENTTMLVENPEMVTSEKLKSMEISLRVLLLNIKEAPQVIQTIKAA
jgi:hypothetical protein